MLDAAMSTTVAADPGQEVQLRKCCLHQASSTAPCRQRPSPSRGTRCCILRCCAACRHEYRGFPKSPVPLAAFLYDRQSLSMSLPSFYSFTQRWHSEPYPSIALTRPELSAASKNVVVTGAGSGSKMPDGTHHPAHLASTLTEHAQLAAPSPSHSLKQVHDPLLYLAAECPDWKRLQAPSQL